MPIEVRGGVCPVKTYTTRNEPPDDRHIGQMYIAGVPNSYVCSKCQAVFTPDEEDEPATSCPICGNPAGTLCGNPHCEGYLAAVKDIADWLRMQRDLRHPRDPNRVTYDGAASAITDLSFRRKK